MSNLCTFWEAEILPWKIDQSQWPIQKYHWHVRWFHAWMQIHATGNLVSCVTKYSFIFYKAPSVEGLCLQLYYCYMSQWSILKEKIWTLSLIANMTHMDIYIVSALCISCIALLQILTELNQIAEQILHNDSAPCPLPEYTEKNLSLWPTMLCAWWLEVQLWPGGAAAFSC